MRTISFIIILFFLSVSAKGQNIINETKSIPYAYVCKIDKFSNGKKYKATGFLIGENYILTNAHVIHNADSLVITPGYVPKKSNPFGKIDIVCKKGNNVFFTDQYVSSTKTPQEDYGLIKFNNSEVIDNMKELLGLDKPYFSFGILDKLMEERYKEKINISGYPCFKFFEFRKKHFQYHNSGFLKKKFKRMPKANLNYKLNTRKCNSGSPLWINVDQKNIVIGIHKSGSGFKNQGVELTEKVVNQINKWIENEI